MKVVVIGGTGMIGSRVVASVTARGHEAVAAAPELGVDTLTGQGLAGALRGADAVVDVTNAPPGDDAAVLEFFTTSTRNQLEVEAESGVPHHVTLSIVGSGALTGSGYMRAKVAQEELVQASSVPSTIVRATQFFEFAPQFTQASTIDGQVLVPAAQVQPVSADEVADALTDVALSAGAQGVVEIGGPEVLDLADFAGRWLAAGGDERAVVVDPALTYFGADIADGQLIIHGAGRRGSTTYAQWLGATA